MFGKELVILYANSLPPLQCPLKQIEVNHPVGECDGFCPVRDGVFLAANDGSRSADVVSAAVEQVDGAVVEVV